MIFCVTESVLYECDTLLWQLDSKIFGIKYSESIIVNHLSGLKYKDINILNDSCFTYLIIYLLSKNIS